MKINEILIEDYHEDNYDEDEQYALHSVMRPTLPGSKPLQSTTEIVEVIKSNCSEILAAYQQSSKVLYRGMKSHNPIVITNIRPNRIPVQMNPLAHTALTTAFTKVGLTANRENSIFCSCRQHIAGDWGSNVYVIFPKNGWSGTVFQTIVDDYSFYQLESMARDYVYNHKNMNKLTFELNSLDPLAVTSQNIKGVLDEEYADVIITGSSYIGIRPDDTLGEQVLSLLEIRIFE